MVENKRRHSPLHKRWAALMLALTLTLTSATALAAAEFAVVYNTDQLNLRKLPDSGSTWLGSYLPGEWMQVSDAPGNWYAVSAPDGKTGYMSRNFLTKGINDYVTIATVQNPKSTQFLNLRKDASYTSQVLGIYYNGVPALVLGESGGWYYVSVDGLRGYFRGEYLKLDETIGSDDIATIVTPNNTGLNLRAGPGTQYASIRQFKGGRYVMVLNRGKNWWKVSIDGYQGYVNTDVLGQYKTGARVTVLNYGSEWSEVTVDATGKTGYMMSSFLTFYNLASPPTMKVDHPTGTFVNLRSGPSMSNTSIIAQVKDGATVQVLIPGTEWVKVRYNKKIGYMVAAFLE